PEPFARRPGPRVVVVVTHVADPDQPPGPAAERLERTLEALLESLGHTQLELVVNTLPGRQVTESLPAHQRARLAVREREAVEPLLLGFAAQDELVARADEADWFLYLEDDLLLGDSLLLE